MVEYTIVATTYNDEKTIHRFLENILGQTYLPLRIIIADGGSSDRTKEIIESVGLKSSIPIDLISKGRLNIAQGYNEAIKAVTTEYVGIAGIGNVYDKEYFEKLSEAAGEAEADIYYSPIRGLDSNKFSHRYNRHLLNGDAGSRLQIASNHGALIKKDVFVKLGYFYEKFIYAGEDGEFYTLAKNKGYKSVIVDEAKVYWETPTDMRLFLKQIEVYTNANMQIYSMEQWKKLSKRILKLSVAFVLSVVYFILLCLPHIHWIVKLLISLLIVVVLYLKRDRLNFFYLFNTYLPIYYTLKNRKYMNEEYSLKR